MHYQLFGPEHRVTKSIPIDCLLILPNPNQVKPFINWIINFDGCYYHFCDNYECHKSNPDPNHSLACSNCLNSSKDALKFCPKLWKMKQNETPKSLHPQKHVPYESVLQKTKDIHSSKSPRHKGLNRDFRSFSSTETRIIK